MAVWEGLKQYSFIGNKETYVEREENGGKKYVQQMIDKYFIMKQRHYYQWNIICKRNKTVQKWSNETKMELKDWMKNIDDEELTMKCWFLMEKYMQCRSIVYTGGNGLDKKWYNDIVKWFKRCFIDKVIRALCICSLSGHLEKDVGANGEFISVVTNIFLAMEAGWVLENYVTTIIKWLNKGRPVDDVFNFVDEIVQTIIGAIVHSGAFTSNYLILNDLLACVSTIKYDIGTKKYHYLELKKEDMMKCKGIMTPWWQVYVFIYLYK